MPLLRQPLLLLARSAGAKRAVTALPATSAVVGRYVPGETRDDAVEAASALVADGLKVTLDRLGEDTLSPEQAEQTVLAYLDLLDALAARGLTADVEVSVKLTALGLRLPDGPDLALAQARRVCARARQVGTTVTLDMEDHTVTDATLGILAELRHDFPETGAVLQSYLHRTEDDCRALATEGSRVRLCKGAYDEPASVAWRSRRDIADSYARCLAVLMRGPGYPMVASHDPAMIQAALHLVAEHGRVPGDHEFQMLYGIRPEEQRRLAAAGETVRVYVPYGTEWWGYLVRRLAERPANLSFFVKSLVSKK